MLFTFLVMIFLVLINLFNEFYIYFSIYELFFLLQKVAPLLPVLSFSFEVYLQSILLSFLSSQNINT